MVRQNTKQIKVFPYKYRLDGVENDSDTLKTTFGRNKMRDNVIEYTSDYSLLLVIDDSRNGFLAGKFMKLRSDSPTIVNIERGEEREVDLEENEDIAEKSHFIWHVNEGIILAEYNYHAIRYLHIPLKYYLNKRFGVGGNTALPLEDTDTYNRFESMNKGIKTFKLGVLRNKMKAIEDKFDISTIRSLIGLSSDHRSVYEVTVKKGGKKGVFLDKGTILRITNGLKEKKESIQYLIIETSDAVYDLVNNILLYYKFSVQKNGKKIDSEDFFEKAMQIFQNNLGEIKKYAEIQESN